MSERPPRRNPRDSSSRPGPKSGNPGGRRVREPLRPDEGGPKHWGSLARKGTRNLSDDERFLPETEKRAARNERPVSPAEAAERAAKDAKRDAAREKREARTAELRSEARDAIDRSTKPKPRKSRQPTTSDRKPMPKVPVDLAEPEAAIAKAVGAKKASRLIRSLENASQEFAAERFTDARNSLKPALDAAGHVAEVRELQGLIEYRLGKWKPATVHLEAFRDMSGTTEQHPVLADCYRALGRHRDVEVLWEELREASPTAALVVEGRIVAAGSLADQGRLDEALELLEAGWNRPKRPRPHHLRRGYALADLYERSGQGPRARALFGWIAGRAPDFADARQRAGD